MSSVPRVRYCHELISFHGIVDGIFVSFPSHVNTQKGVIREISRKCEVNNCQFPIPLGIVYICMVLLGIVAIPISQFLDTPQVL